MPGVLNTVIHIPRIVRGPGDRGIVTDPSLKAMVAAGANGGDLVPGVIAMETSGSAEIIATADTLQAWIIKNIHDVYGHMIPAQYVANASIAVTHRVSVIPIGGVYLEVTEDGVGTSIVTATDLGKFACFLPTANTTGQTSFPDNPIGVGVAESWFIDSNALSSTVGAANGANFKIISESNDPGNPVHVANGQRNWIIRIDDTKATQSQ